MSLLKRFLGRGKSAEKCGSGGDWASGFQLDSEHWRGAWLSVLNGACKGKTYRLGERVVTVGRSHANFIQIPDAHVSRTHCQIRPVPGGYEVQDMKSRLGTTVGGRRVDRELLVDKSEICLGTTRLRFEADVSHAVDHGLARKEVHKVTQLETDYVDTKEQAAAGTTLEERLLVLGKLKQVVESGHPRLLVLRTVALAVVEQLAADRAVFLTATGRGWKVEAHFPRPDLPVELQKILPDKKLMSKAASSGQPACASDSTGDGPRAAMSDSTGDGPRAAMAVPLFGPEHVVGLLYLDRLAQGASRFEGVDVSFVGQVTHLLSGPSR